MTRLPITELNWKPIKGSIVMVIFKLRVVFYLALNDPIRYNKQPPVATPKTVQTHYRAVLKFPKIQ